MTDRAYTIPWPSIILALMTTLAIWLSGVSFFLSLTILLVWLGTLWLVILRPPTTSRIAQDEDALATGDVARLIEFASIPIMVVCEGRIEIANRAARKLLGNHILGQDVRMALRQPQAIRLFEKKKRGFVQLRGLSRRRDEWRLNQYILEDGRAVIELLDHTSVADISRAHSDFVANASHELRTPLASITGYIETLRDEGEDLDDETKTRFFNTVLSEGQRLQSLVSDLMSLSRIEAEKHDQPEERVDLAPLVERSARQIAGIKREERLQLTLEDGITILGDEMQLEQMIRNLVDNALNYSEDDQPVAITLTCGENDEAEISVADMGQGVTPEEVPLLTRRFYRTDPGRSRENGGTGLGLAIVKHIVERHRGRLDIKSERGHGTSVLLRFPLVADDKPE